MIFNTIISAKELAQHINNPSWRVFDCRFYLQEPDRGYQEYLEGHIPGASYLNLDKDLSGEIIPGETGRHPLPALSALVDRLGSWGISNQSQVIVYDDESGAFGARLWWMLNYLGHDRVAILDGGWSGWVESGGEIDQNEHLPDGGDFLPNLQQDMAVDANFVLKVHQESDYILLDARSRERYNGTNETTDPVSGHIPGAVSAPYSENLTPEGFLKPKAELKKMYEDLFGGHSPGHAIVYCGSGVTAAFNALTIVHAGFNLPKLYPGSWSEWITDQTRPTIS